MAVENPNTINELNPNWPDGLDPKSQGDDHIRNIKGALKRTFPNVTGVITASTAQLNRLSQGGTTNTPGMIMLWAYGVDQIPAGWKVCNGVGTISTGQPVPNLSDKFIMGAGTTYPVGSFGGSASHSHNGSVGGTSLTIDQLPEHDHTQNGWFFQGLTGGGGQVRCSTDGGDLTGKTGSGAPHVHPLTINSASNLPPYASLFYIIKD